jgi:hypothetical protein
MKTMLKLPQLCGAVLLISCTTSELPPDKNVLQTTPSTSVVIDPPTNSTNNATDVLPPLYPFGNQTSFIKGQVSATASTANVSSFMTTRMAAPDMGTILKSGEKLNMVAMGGGMTAGVRNGGLYRYGQMTAYPNLVARQMGMTDFQSPLFAENEANGTGYLQLIEDGTQYPSWKEVNNNKTITKAGNPPELSKYIGGSINNYAFPEGSLEIIGRPVNNNGGLGIFDRTWSTGQVFISRMMPVSVDVASVPLRKQIFKQPVNFYIIEDNVDILLSAIKYNANALSSYGYNISSVGPTMLSYTLELLKENSNADKGVLFTWPIITDLAYFNWFTIQDLKSKAKNISILTTRNNENFVIDGSNNNFLFMPTPTIDGLFRNLKKGDNISITLEDTDILDPQEFNINTLFIKRYNDRIRQLAKDKGLAIVDLEKIYGQIHSNSYVSSDGFKIDGGTRGNFFSADGIYPTAIGQAVIANEVIKSINATYKSSIPFINLKDYSLSVGKE